MRISTCELFGRFRILRISSFAFRIYTNGVKPSLIIIGLGNPGKEYEMTRHNVGFRAVDLLAEEYGTSDWQDKQKFLSHICEARLITFPVLLVKPTTYMNNSGNAIRKLIDFYKLNPVHQLLVICDDIDQLVGESRMRDSGGPGTHNGRKSICDQFGDEYLRLRIGVRGAEAPEGSFQKAGMDLSAYILSRPNKEDQEVIDQVITKVPNRLRELV